MIIVNVSDSGTRYPEQTVNEAMGTPRSLFDKLGVNYSRGITSLNGTILSPDKLDMTFSELGISGGRAILNSVVKGDGGSF